MTKCCPSNKKPSSLNKSLGNSLSNDRDITDNYNHRAEYDGNDIKNPAFMEREVNHYIDSVTEETSLEEFMAKAELAGTEFTAETEEFQIIEKNFAIVVPTRVDYRANLELQKENEHRLRIPRRAAKELWENMEELTRLENDAFLQWRSEGGNDIKNPAFMGHEINNYIGSVTRTRRVWRSSWQKQSWSGPNSQQRRRNSRSSRKTLRSSFQLVWITGRKWSRMLKRPPQSDAIYNGKEIFVDAVGLVTYPRNFCSRRIRRISIRRPPLVSVRFSTVSTLRFS